MSWAGHSGIPATGGEHVNEDNAQQSGADLAENAFMERDEPIGVDGFGVMKLGAGLRVILKSL